MTDWEATCSAFNQYQEDGSAGLNTNMQYPGSCSLKFADMSMGKLMELTATLNQLDKDRIAGTYAEGTQGLSLKTAMKQYCCAMWARKEYQTQLNNAKQDYDVAKQRVDSLRNPPADVSYLGTTVPFGRPLRSDSVPVLVSLSLIFLIVGLGMLLGLGNIGFVSIRKGPGFAEYFAQLRDAFGQTPLSVLGLTIAGAAAVAGGLFYWVLKSKPEWLGYKEQ